MISFVINSHRYCSAAFLVSHACRLPLHHATGQLLMTAAGHPDSYLLQLQDQRFTMAGYSSLATSFRHDGSEVLAAEAAACDAMRVQVQHRKPCICVQGFTRPARVRVQPASIHSQPAEPARRATITAASLASSVCPAILSCMQQRNSTAPPVPAA